MGQAWIAGAQNGVAGYLGTDLLLQGVLHVDGGQDPKAVVREARCDPLYSFLKRCVGKQPGDAVVGLAKCVHVHSVQGLGLLQAALELVALIVELLTI